MLIQAQSPSDFSPSTTPQWVTEWLGRRRTTAPQQTQSNQPKSLLQATAAAAEEPKADDPAAIAKRQQASLKRQEVNQAMIAEGLADVQQWVSDQLTSGLMSFLDSMTQRCRMIAARLVDNKAAALASRIDEMPSRIMALPSEEQPDTAIRELGKIIVLAKAWQLDPLEPQVARDVGATERKDDVINNPDSIRVNGTWEIVGEQIRSRRDGLVSQSAWFMRLGEDDLPRFALLLDFFPASVGRRVPFYVIGSQYTATMVYYPSKAPLRAIALDVAQTQDDLGWPQSQTTDPLSGILHYADAVPWQLEYPIQLPTGRIVSTNKTIWWRTDTGAELPLVHEGHMFMPQIQGIPLTQAVGIWDGARLTLLSVRTPWGKVVL